MDSHRVELRSGERFDFGSNWQRFIEVLDERQIDDAKVALLRLLGEPSIESRTLVDVGSGSGLSSLAAVRAGASVTSFDYDPRCVAATHALRASCGSSAERWTVIRGSVLDPGFMESLGEFDIVYSWGVLHHTGAMWAACAAVGRLVTPGGLLAIALYNDQGLLSRYWTSVKRLYNSSRGAAVAMLALHAPFFVLARIVGNLKHLLIGTRRDERGMRFWRDIVDWVGGYPFEVATIREVTEFFQQRGFDLVKVVGVGRRHGCNEFVFRRVATNLNNAPRNQGSSPASRMSSELSP